jgi:hypothetical protein
MAAATPSTTSVTSTPTPQVPVVPTIEKLKTSWNAFAEEYRQTYEPHIVCLGMLLTHVVCRLLFAIAPLLPVCYLPFLPPLSACLLICQR